MIMPSSGVHVMLPDYYSPEHMGLIVPKTKDGRVVFMLPWLEQTIAGTTDSSSDITMRPQVCKARTGHAWARLRAYGPTCCAA